MDELRKAVPAFKHYETLWFTMRKIRRQFRPVDSLEGEIWLGLEKIGQHHVLAAFRNDNSLFEGRASVVQNVDSEIVNSFVRAHVCYGDLLAPNLECFRGLDELKSIGPWIKISKQVGDDPTPMDEFWRRLSKFLGVERKGRLEASYLQQLLDEFCFRNPRQGINASTVFHQTLRLMIFPKYDPTLR